MKLLTLKISGKVQGVFFRESTLEIAQKLGLVGYVKNEADGTVAVYAEGEETELKKLLEWCKIGPRLARVERVEEKWEEIEERKFGGFEIGF